jgi:hypothetical protein
MWPVVPLGSLHSPSFLLLALCRLMSINRQCPALCQQQQGRRVQLLQEHMCGGLHKLLLHDTASEQQVMHLVKAWVVLWCWRFALYPVRAVLIRSCWAPLARLVQTGWMMLTATGALNCGGGSMSTWEDQRRAQVICACLFGPATADDQCHLVSPYCPGVTTILVAAASGVGEGFLEPGLVTGSEACTTVPSRDCWVGGRGGFTGSRGPTNLTQYRLISQGCRRLNITHMLAPGIAHSTHVCCQDTRCQHVCCRQPSAASGVHQLTHCILSRCTAALLHCFCHVHPNLLSTPPFRTPPGGPGWQPTQLPTHPTTRK